MEFVFWILVFIFLLLFGVGYFVYKIVLFVKEGGRANKISVNRIKLERNLVNQKVEKEYDDMIKDQKKKEEVYDIITAALKKRIINTQKYDVIHSLDYLLESAPSRYENGCLLDSMFKALYLSIDGLVPQELFTEGMSGWGVRTFPEQELFYQCGAIIENNLMTYWHEREPEMDVRFFSTSTEDDIFAYLCLRNLIPIERWDDRTLREWRSRCPIRRGPIMKL